MKSSLCSEQGEWAKCPVPGSSSRPRRRDQDPSRAPGHRSRGTDALPAGSQGDCRAVAHAHSGHLRRRRRSGRELHASPSSSKARPCAHAAARGDVPVGATPSRSAPRSPPGWRACEGDHPSRPQAGQHLPDQRRRREDPRLRAGPMASQRVDSGRDRHRNRHSGGDRGRDGRLHVPRASTRRCGQRTSDLFWLEYVLQNGCRPPPVDRETAPRA